MKSIKRVNNRKGLVLAIEDKETEGFELKSSSDNQAYMIKHNGFGSIFGHLLVFIFFGWWTFLFANLIYAIYKYITDTDELYIKIGKI